MDFAGVNGVLFADALIRVMRRQRLAADSAADGAKEEISVFVVFKTTAQVIGNRDAVGVFDSARCNAEVLCLNRDSNVLVLQDLFQRCGDFLCEAFLNLWPS